MPKFSSGDPQLRFRRKDGKTFVKTFHSRVKAARAFKGWRKAGGEVVGSSSLATKGGHRYSTGEMSSYRRMRRVGSRGRRVSSGAKSFLKSLR